MKILSFFLILSTVNYCIAGIYKQPTAFESNTNEVKRISVIVALADVLAQTGACKPKEKNKAEKKRHKCDFCDKTSRNQSELKIHKRTHTGEKPFPCIWDGCSKSFTLLSTLANHKKTHTGVKPYACDICPKAFAKQCNLITHKRTHTGEKPYKCSQCGKAFSESGTCKKHIKRLCNMATVIKEGL